MKNYHFLFLVSLILLAFSSTSLSSQESIAFILSKTGKVELIRQNGQKLTKFDNFTELFEGDSLVVHEESIVEIFYVNGKIKTCHGIDSIKITMNGQSIVNKKESIFKIILKKLTNSTKTVKEHLGATRSGSLSFSVLAPRKCYVPYETIQFEWTSFYSAKEYEFILSESNSFDTPLYRRIVQDTSIIIHPDSLILKRGYKYYWKINPLSEYSGTWDSSFFQIYSFADEKIFLSQRNQIHKIFGKNYEIPLIAYLEIQQAYYAEYKFLSNLLASYPNNKRYYEFMADLMSQLGVPELAHKYSVRAFTLKYK